MHIPVQDNSYMHLYFGLYTLQQLNLFFIPIKARRDQTRFENATPIDVRRFYVTPQLNNEL